MELSENYNLGPSPPSEEKIERLKSIVRAMKRPFTLIELAPQVKDVTKKEFEEIFLLLVERGDVLVKKAGKIIIYFYNYKKNAPDVSTELKKEISKTSALLEDTLAEIREIKYLLQRGLTEVPFGELELEVSAAKYRLKKMEKRVEEKKKKLPKPVDQQENQALKRQYEKYLDEYQKRKWLCLRVVDFVGDRYSKPRKTLMSEMKIECDEQADFNINEYKL